MNLVAAAIQTVERLPLPDAVTLAGIDWLVGRQARRLRRAADGRDFAGAMNRHAIAEHADAANRQHYELPPGFFTLTLGARRKYSCCLYENDGDDLARAEEQALAATVAHADLVDGQEILELGCGWGSLTLYMAARYPRAHIVAVSNSIPQRLYIEGEAKARHLDNVRVITADMNDFNPEGGFDRIVSVEMFEHMGNWHGLLQRVRRWLKPDGRLFIHVFTHRDRPYRFDHRDPTDWIGQYFFTGGIMPSHDLIHHFPDCFVVEREWRWNGQHYKRTALDWLANFDANRPAIDRILQGVYGRDAALWGRRWRLFYLATAGLFGYRGGEEWGVSHYRLRAMPEA